MLHAYKQPVNGYVSSMLHSHFIGMVRPVF